MLSKRAYRIRSYINGRSKGGAEYTNYMITVPSEIAEALPDGLQFTPRMTEEGLLYEPVTNNTGIELPEWAKQKQESNGKQTEKEKNAK